MVVLVSLLILIKSPCGIDGESLGILLCQGCAGGKDKGQAKWRTLP
jgi:hypothetical protein